MKNILLTTLFFCLFIGRGSGQSLPLYFPLDKLVTYLPLESDEIENSIDKRYPDNTYKIYNRSAQDFAFVQESIKFKLDKYSLYKGDKYIGQKKSLDRFSKERPGFLSELRLLGDSINYFKPITIGFWSSSESSNRVLKLDYISEDRLKLSVQVQDGFATVEVKQFANELYQSDKFYVEKLAKEALYSTSSGEKWHLLIVEFDFDKISVSINGEPLQTFNLTFLKKRDFKKKNSNTDLKRFLKSYSESEYGETQIKGALNIDDVFIYQKLLTNEEITAIIHSDLSPYYFKEIRDSIKSIHLGFNDLSKNNELTRYLSFMNYNLTEFNKYLTKFNELKTYRKVLPQRNNIQSKSLLDSLIQTHFSLEKQIGIKIDYILDSLLAKPTKDNILSVYNTYVSSGTNNINQIYSKQHILKFKKAVANYFYYSLNVDNVNSQAQQKLVSDINLDFKNLLGDAFDVDKAVDINPPKEGVIKFYSTSNQYINNPNYDYNDDPSVYMINSARKIKWDQKELSFINSKLEGVQKFYDTGRLVYEYELKQGKLIYEKWYDYSDPAIQPKILDKFYDSKVYYERGKQKIMNQQYSKATLDFTNAIRLSPNNADYYFLRGSSFVSLSSTVNVENDFLTSAKDDFDKAIELNKSNAGFYFSRGMVRFQLKDLDGSYQDLKQAVDMGYKDDKNQLTKIYTLKREKDQKDEAAARAKQIQDEKNARALEVAERAKYIQEEKRAKALASQVFRLGEAAVCDNFSSYMDRNVQIRGFYAASQSQNQGWSLRRRNDFNEEQLNSSLTFQFYSENEYFYTRVVFVGSCPVILRIPRELQNVPNILSDYANITGVVIGSNKMRVTSISR